MVNRWNLLASSEGRRAGQPMGRGAPLERLKLAVALLLVTCTAALAVPDGVLMAGAENEVVADRGDPDRAVPSRPSETLVGSLDSNALRDLIGEVLTRNPEIARATRVAEAAASRAPQVGARPDPVVALTAFALPPETRVGPQRFSAGLQQSLPWLGKLELEERASLFDAAAAQAEIEIIRLDKLTEARRIVYELAFLAAHESVLVAERETLVRYEGVSQARYAAGTGLQQEILRIQAQITRLDTQLLGTAERRASLTSTLNALRDRAADVGIDGFVLPDPRFHDLDRRALRELAAQRRPEIEAAEARIAAADARVELAEKSSRPDFHVGLSYTVVGRREDAAGRASPVEDDGDDILALTGSMNLPVRHRKLEARVDEAHATRRAAEEGKRHLLAEIDAATGDLTARLPLLATHLQLLESVLLKQAEEALRSTETAYSTGELNAMDLLDAEFVLFEVRIAAARTRADLAIALADLERAIAHPVEILREGDST